VVFINNLNERVKQMTYLYDFTAVRFYPYPSAVSDRVFFCDYYYDDNIKEFFNYLLSEFNRQGIKARNDNKVVFECHIDGNKVFYGFKDWIFSIGFRVIEL
jgi:hypothetical protein